MLIEKVQRVREELESLIQKYLEEDCVPGFSARQLNWPTPEDVINALRMGQPHEATYGLLQQFVKMNRGAPIITTKRGNILYVDYNPVSEKLFLYIGATKDLVKISESGDRALYVLAVFERYDYLPYTNSQKICRLHIQKEGLTDFASYPDRNPHELVPALFFYTFEEAAESAVCTLRTEWLPGRTETSEGANLADRDCSELAFLSKAADWLEDEKKKIS